MTLPVLKIIKHEITLPDSKTKIKVRPYLTGEEKGLLMAIESKDSASMQEAIRNLVEACVLTEDFKIDLISFMDLEFIFIQLRKISVDSNVKLQFIHDEKTDCTHVTEVVVPLDSMEFEGKAEKKIVLQEEPLVGVVMKTPNTSILEAITSETNVEKTFEMIYSCIDYIYDAEEVYKDFTREDLHAWVDNLNEKQLKQIMNFFESMPKIVYNIEYTCPECGVVEKKKIEGILSFL